MTTAQFREALRAQPFRPFLLRLTNDRTYDIDHPELAMVVGAGPDVVIQVNHGAGAIILDLKHVATLEYWKAEAEGGGA